ncbi:transporter substrate-binding domain-containing protein [Pseudomonas putida]|uniref:histidine kinase n=1 Tax=Pseudomonas putida TaxID=303 RepID=A0A4D6XAS2_PSEPU|nr:transporter substrate-binding domain-containing protein [Pseudomonas putida]QCI11488.1 transporter substrate-binding domain-containing protein [Pseudomonas putida]
MPRYLPHLLLALALVGAEARASEPPPTPYMLLPRSTANPVQPPLSDPQRRWLQSRRQLLLGTSAPDYPPFDITTGGRDYQGLTAEYAHLIGKALEVPIRVVRYPSRNAAVDALKRGDIDLLGSANGYEAAVDGLALSHPYAVDQPVLVTREDETRPLDDGLTDMRLGTLDHYLPSEEIHTTYPKARLMAFGSTTQALNAVAFGQADVFIGDTISTHYQLHRGHLPGLRMANFSKHEAVGFGFAMRSQDTLLHTLVNTALDSQPSAVHGSIFKRWSAGSDLLLTDRQLQLTPAESQWLRQHPVMRVAIDETAAPVSFFDVGGHFRGVTADLLELIRLRTGLRFEVQRASGTADMLARLEGGRVDLIAALASDNLDAQHLRISRPYLESTQVLVTRDDQQQVASLDDLQGRRIAITRYSTLDELLARDFPQIAWIETENTYYSIALLETGAVDAVITTLIDANHAISQSPALIIRSAIDTEPASFAMATRVNDTELASVLDKALASISPEELGVINNRWRGYGPPDNKRWQRLRHLAVQVLLGTGVLLVLAVLWNTRLRRQIRQRQQAERALGDQLAFMRALLNGTPHPMYVRDREGHLQSCNNSYLEAVQACAEDAIGKRLEQSPFCDPAHARQIEADYQQVMRAGTPLILDRPLHVRGREMTIYHWILPYRDSLGEVQGIIGGWIDISERRELVEELRLAKQQADDANRAKSTFLATISHEIRTPMNALIGMLELASMRAEQGQLDRTALDVAYQSGRDLLGLIGDILDIARIESGHMSLVPETVDVAALIASVERVFEGQARQKGLVLETEIAPSACCHALLDPLRLKQILSNLVSNAIKFTDHGQVRIQACVPDACEEDPPSLLLEVRDSGIGIHDDDMQRLFTPFAQANPHSQGARAGTGLGLAICRSLAEMMGASLQLKSLQGVGTQVRLSLPLYRAEAPTAEVRPAEYLVSPNPHLRVLVIDDHPANLLLMAHQLNHLGLQQTTAQDGREGLATFRNGQFDVVIVDCNMPHMNGYQLARAIRAHERKHGLAPCTLLGYTANAQPEVRQRCLDAGMDDCLLKPISLATLCKHLARVLPRQLERPATDRPFDLSGLDAVVGLVAEDRERFLDTVRESLRQDYLTLMALVIECDAGGLVEQAHKILSVARMLEAKPMMAACAALEEEGLSVTQLRVRRQALARHMRRVEKALGQPVQVGPGL